MIAAGLAAAALAVSVVVFLAWTFLAPDTARSTLDVKANTALALALSAGAALIFARAPRGRASARVLGALVSLIGLVTLYQYATGADVGIDRVFTASDRGRMGSNTAAMLACLGVGTATALSARRKIWVFGHAMVLLAILIAFLAIVGHVLGVPPLYRVSAHTQMAWLTALLAVAVASSILALEPRRGVMSILTSAGGGGFLARRLLPVVLLVPVGMTWLTLIGVRRGLYGIELATALDVVVCVASMLAVTMWCAQSLNRVDEMRQRGEAQVRTLSQRLRTRAAALAESNQELESFSYSVSHDLRGPIRHISGFTELLEASAGPSLDAQSRHYLRTIADASVRAGRLIDDLLEFSRMGRAEMRRSAVNLNNVVADAWQSLAPDVQGRDVQLKVGELPRVTGDREMLMLAVQNLLSNAVKYTRPRQPAVIEVTAAVIGNEVVVSVRDNGVGFDMRYVNKLFGVFQRLHPPKSFEGIGIGLANVKRIMQRHDGRVWADGVVDQGATFSFALPHQSHHAAHPEQAEHQEHPEAP